MEHIAIKAILWKVRSKEICQTINKWSFLRKEDIQDIQSQSISAHLTKLSLVSYITEKCQVFFKRKNVFELIWLSVS